MDQAVALQPNGSRFNPWLWQPIFFCNITSPYEPEGNDMRHEKTNSVSKIKPVWEPWEEDETPRKKLPIYKNLAV